MDGQIDQIIIAQSVAQAAEYVVKRDGKTPDAVAAQTGDQKGGALRRFTFPDIDKG